MVKVTKERLVWTNAKGFHVEIFVDRSKKTPRLMLNDGDYTSPVRPETLAKIADGINDLVDSATCDFD